VIIIRAAGRHFCAGHYLGEMVDQDICEYKKIYDRCARMMEMIHTIPQVVIAQVDQPDASALDHATQTMTANNMAEVTQTGISAFLNKASPRWKNR
jgi:hypothetical protein